MGQPIYVVDAFADRPFAGNPAGVCPLAGPADEGWMRRVAMEMNHAETAFLHPEGDGWRLRWFTPAVEVDLCGHATLAAAHALWETGRHTADAVTFFTRSGVLTVARDGAGYAMDFPALPVSATEPPAGLAEALGAVPLWVGTSGMDVIAEYTDEAAVRAVAPDFGKLAAIRTRGVIVTAASADPRRADFVSRFFAPACGVPEDPVTGSAHCALGPFWAARLGKTDVVGYQASPRGGAVRVTVRGDRVTLGGTAVTVLRGELLPAA